MRSQTTVDDGAYMRDSSSLHRHPEQRARIVGPRVRKLTDGIIAAQRKEIGEMKEYIDDLEARR
ncbi:hypothetical protein GCM10007388_31830 [Pseudoduganella plicata]|uniref:DUF305 domain-containing protein n=2 Tax=Pseudoduganella plicata TaxID=321984 RepID=A0AA88C908_9BURK|nr:hypothetical protein GCM10007388_31830 [Pseudoduganella plicata]